MTLRYLSQRYLSIVAFALAIASLQVTMVEASDRIDVIVPLGEGGALDRFARTAQRFLNNGMDLEVSVENFSPKSGQDGYREFLNRPADGSTVLAWFEPAVAAYGSGASLDDLTIINVQEIEPPILAVRSDLGWTNLSEMVAALRRTPNRYRFGYGSATAGGSILTSALLNNLGLKIVAAGYRSGGKARKAVARGDVDFTAGSLKALQKMGDQVVPLVPSQSLPAVFPFEGSGPTQAGQ